MLIKLIMFSEGKSEEGVDYDIEEQEEGERKVNIDGLEVRSTITEKKIECIGTYFFRQK